TARHSLDVGDASRFGDLLNGGRGEGPSRHVQLLAGLALAQHLHGQLGITHQPRLDEGLGVDRRTVLKALIELLDVDDGELPGETGVAEATLGDTAEQRQLTTFAAGTDGTGRTGTGAG